jgi:protein-S-isoprenylcysteine O-methyltransferase Ste14
MAMVDSPDHADVRMPPPLLYLGALLIGLVVGRLLHIGGFAPHRSLSLYLGGVLTIGGAALVLAAAGLFRRLHTNVKPSQPATTLVTSGLYRRTRNPMYLGMSLLYAGPALILDSILALLLLPIVLIVIQTQVIAREERYLEGRFGDDYRSYRQRVRRWF